MGPQSFEQRTRLGKTFSLGTPKLAIVLGGNFRAILANPVAGSGGKTMFIYAMVAANDSTGFSWGKLYQNPDTGVPSTNNTTPINQNLTSANTSAATLKYDTNLVTALSGGTSLYPVEVPNQTRTVMKEELIILPPGMSLGLNVAFAIAGNAAFKIYYWEED